jgi:CheY-like chemotaxis protein
LPHTPGRPRVLLADDDPAICKAITRLLAPSCEVIVGALDAATLFEEVARIRPDVVLLDFSLPGGDGLEVCRRIKQMMPEVSVVVVTANNDSDLERLAYEVGATGFVWKPQAWTHLWPAIQTVLGRTPRPDAG